MTEYILERNYDTKNGTFSTVKREEIVRCRDCSYYEHEVYTFRELKEEYHRCLRDWNGEPVSSDVEPDGFCAWGERKVEG